MQPPKWNTGYYIYSLLKYTGSHDLKVTDVKGCWGQSLVILLHFSNFVKTYCICYISPCTMSLTSILCDLTYLTSLLCISAHQMLKNVQNTKFFKSFQMMTRKSVSCLKRSVLVVWRSYKVKVMLQSTFKIFQIISTWALW